MTRSVYFDPFGKRLEGQQAGIRDEAFLQSSARDARLSDWQFNNELPLRLQGARREEDFAQHADPFRRRDLNYNENATQDAQYDRHFNQAGAFGLATGIDAPINNLMFDHFKPDRTYTELDPNTRMPVADPSYIYNTYGGGMHNYGLHPGSTLSYLDRDYSMKKAEFASQEAQRRQQAQQASDATAQSAQWEQLQRQWQLQKMFGGQDGAGGTHDSLLDW